MQRMDGGTQGSAKPSTKARLATILAVCGMAAVIVVALVVLRPVPQVSPVLVTNACGDQVASSLNAMAELTDSYSVPVTRRGFLYKQGAEGDPGFDIIPITNPSFEAVSPLRGWHHVHQCSASVNTEQVRVGPQAAEVTSWDGVFGRFGMDDPLPPEEAAGRTFTFGAWIWTDQPERVRLLVIDRAPDYGSAVSGFHPGDGHWHWLTVTRTIRSEGLVKWAIVSQHLDGSVFTYYVDGAILAEGPELDVVFDDGEFGAGEYSLSIAGLQPNTSYRVRAFAQNQAGIGYGNTVTCRTWG